MEKEDTLWSYDEIKDSVLAYKFMQNELSQGRKLIKIKVYKDLSKKWGRTEKSFERRMSNISSVLYLAGRSWLPGLKPLDHVGKNVSKVIFKCLEEIEGTNEFNQLDFEIEVEKSYQSLSVQPPKGEKFPNKVLSAVNVYSRDPEVKAWLLKNSEGLCEACEDPAPFYNKTNIPFLEIHHIVRLADQGEDVIENAVAVCPNCHKALHFSKDKEELKKALVLKIKRLKKSF